MSRTIGDRPLPLAHRVAQCFAHWTGASLVCGLVLWLGAFPGAHATPQGDRPEGPRPPASAPFHPGDAGTPGSPAEIVHARGSTDQERVPPHHLAFNGSSGEAAQPRRPASGKMVGNAGSLVILYPEIGEPYRGVFAKIIEGVENRVRSQVVSIAVNAETDISLLRNALKARDYRVVIALGRQGMQVANALGKEFAVVVGGVVSVPEAEARDLEVVSLTPDPALLFARLKGLIPGARRVHVIYDPRQNGWLIRQAREAVREQDLELVAVEARDLQTAVRRYQDLLAAAEPGRDVLWLPHDSTTVEESTILPLVLREAWERRLPVISSSIGHVKRGTLFTLYPDNFGLGRHLAATALGLLASPETTSHGMASLKDVLIAVNLRTARHLGLNLGSEQQRGFDLVFAAQ